MLYEVSEAGFKTFLPSPVAHCTVDNLKKQGLHEWDKLILRYNLTTRTISHCIHLAWWGNLGSGDYLLKLTKTTTIFNKTRELPLNVSYCGIALTYALA
jgi:hypothetical protein